jgi:aspartate oxidase
MFQYLHTLVLTLEGTHSEKRIAGIPGGGGRIVLHQNLILIERQGILIFFLYNESLFSAVKKTNIYFI